MSKRTAFYCGFLGVAAIATGCGMVASPGGTSQVKAVTTPGSCSTSNTNPTPTPTPTQSECPPFQAGCSSGGSSNGLTGSISYSSQTGLISGNATKNGSSSVVSVSIYANGPMGTGTLLANVQANQVIVNGGSANGFTYQPSSSYVNSNPIEIYAYMVPSGSTTTLISGAPIVYIAGADAKGQSYYNANLQNTLSTQCASCHQSSWGNYFTARGELASPDPLSGGTATNNALYLNASGQMGHAGGNQCANNPTLCQDLENWYNMDFGK